MDKGYKNIILPQVVLRFAQRECPLWPLYAIAIVAHKIYMKRKSHMVSENFTHMYHREKKKIATWVATIILHLSAKWKIYAMKTWMRSPDLPIESDYTTDPHRHQFYRLYSEEFHRLVEYKEIMHGLLSR